MSVNEGERKEEMSREGEKNNEIQFTHIIKRKLSKNEQPHTTCYM